MNGSMMEIYLRWLVDMHLVPQATREHIISLLGK